MPEPITLAEIVIAGVASAIDNLHTSMPGKVVAYNPLTQCADVQPMAKRVMFDADGNKSYEDLPTIPNVPVQFPRAGGYVITLPMGPGDFVWLVFSEASTAEYRATGQASAQGDVRRHHLGYPTAIPGAVPDTSPLSPTDAAARAAGMVIGHDGAADQIQISPTAIKLGSAATDFVALASLVMTQLSAIQTQFNTHVHATAALGPPVPPTVPMTSPGSVAATLVKAI